ncbi:SLC13 family permease, partial [Streptomyces sp. T21Q-yed]
MALLIAVLFGAVLRPFGLPEAAVAVPAAGVAIATGVISPAHAWAEVERLGPVVGFLAAVLVLAHFCDVEGLFRACGAWMARWAAGSPGRLLTAVFALGSAITAVLSLDATVVLLTPVVLATAARAGVRAEPHVYACAHLSNTASLLLPVSNLTNLLAFEASGLSFTRFAALMTLPWLAAIGAEYLVFRRWFADELMAPVHTPDAGKAPELPLFALVTVGCTLAGFVMASAVGVEPAWAALAGALV